MTYIIHTDASFRLDSGLASWAYWIDGSDGFSAKDYGVFDRPLASSQLAELLAFWQAMMVVNEQVRRHHRHRVTMIVNTDCRWVIDIITGYAKQTKHKKIVAAVRSYAKEYNIIVNHVRAHTDDDTREAWINNWCDNKAKRVLKDHIRGGTSDGKQE